MDLETVMENEVHQTQKHKCCISTYIHHIWKNGIDELICKAETDTDVDSRHIVTKWVRGDGRDWEVGIDMYTLMCIEQITNENLVHSIGNSSQCSRDFTGKEIQGTGDIFIHVADSLRCTAEAQHCKVTIPQFKI